MPILCIFRVELDPERHTLQTYVFSILNMSIFIILRAPRLLGSLTFYRGCFEHTPTHFVLIPKKQLKHKVVYYRHKMSLNITNQECL